MFNFNNLQVILRVSPEISPSNFYTKEEAKRMFVEDVPEYDKGNVFGRTNGQWVKIDGQYDKLFAGFSIANSIETLTANNNLDSLHEYPYIKDTSGVTAGIRIKEKTTVPGYVFWLITPYELQELRLVSGDIVETINAGTFEKDSTTYNAYKVEGLKVGEYIFEATINSQANE